MSVYALVQTGFKLECYFRTVQKCLTILWPSITCRENISTKFFFIKFTFNINGIIYFPAFVTLVVLSQNLNINNLQQLKFINFSYENPPSLADRCKTNCLEIRAIERISEFRKDFFGLRAEGRHYGFPWTDSRAKCEANSHFSAPSRVTLASWRHFAAIRPPRDRYLNVPYRELPPQRCRATNKSDASARPSPASATRSRVSPPPFLRLRSRPAYFSLSLSLPPALSATGKRRRHSLSQVTRAVHLDVERERVRFFSLVAAGRREGAPWPWGQFPDLLLRSLFLAILFTARLIPDVSRASFLSSIVSSGLVSALIAIGSLCPRAREFSWVPFRSVKWIVFGGSSADFQWCTCTLGLVPHRRT